MLLIYLCVRSDEPNEMLDHLCTDFIYTLPVDFDGSEWKNLLLLPDPLELFRTRNLKIRIHVSIPDYYLLTTSLSEMPYLLNYLNKLQSSSLIVMISQDTNPGVLQQVLNSYLSKMESMQLSISLPSNPYMIIRAYVDQGVVDSVDTVFTVLPQYYDTSSYIDQLLEYGIPVNKLVIGLASVLPSATLFCRDLFHWHPRRISNDQVVWTNPSKNGLDSEFKMFMGNQANDLFNSSNVRGLLLFDLDFDEPFNPICSLHKARFLRSVKAAISNQTISESVLPNISNEISHWESELDLNGSLGATIVYETSNQMEAYASYFDVIDAESLLASPIEHVVLGYDENGQIFDISQPSCIDDLPSVDILDNQIIKRYAIDTLVKNYVINNTILPNVLVFPDIETSDNAHPTFITWIQLLNSTTTTQIITNQTQMHMDSTSRFPGFDCSFLGWTFLSPRKVGDMWVKLTPMFLNEEITTAIPDLPSTTVELTTTTTTTTEIPTTTTQITTTEATTTTTQAATTPYVTFHPLISNNRKPHHRRDDHRTFLQELLLPIVPVSK